MPDYPTWRALWAAVDAAARDALVASDSPEPKYALGHQLDRTAHVWLAQVSTLPSVLAWVGDYEAEFGEAPVIPVLSALYFDAASLLLKRLQQLSKVVHGNLVIDRVALAKAVRTTRGYLGITCKITLDRATGNRIDNQAALARCAEG